MKVRTRTIKPIDNFQPRGVLGHVCLPQTVLPFYKLGFPTFDPSLFPDPVEIIIDILHPWNLISLMQGPLLVLLHALLPREHKQIPLQAFDSDGARDPCTRGLILEFSDEVQLAFVFEVVKPEETER